MSDKLNPIIKFKEWFDLATEKEINDPNAMCLSTVDDKNTPHSRMVLLKDYNDEGFIFYTNYESNKGNDILKNANVCLNFHWKSLLRQIRIEGKVEKISKEISDKELTGTVIAGTDKDFVDLDRVKYSNPTSIKNFNRVLSSFMISSPITFFCESNFVSSIDTYEYSSDTDDLFTPNFCCSFPILT